MFVRVLLLVLIALTAWALFARDSGAGGPERAYRVEPGVTETRLETRFLG